MNNSRNENCSPKAGSTFFRLLKYRLIFCFKNPIFYISALIFSLFTTLNFFVRQNFFTNGNTNLLLYFSAVPYISIIVLPFLCYKKSFSAYDNFIPVKYITKLSADFLCNFIQFSVMVLLLVPAILLVNLFGSLDYGQIFTSIFCLLCYGAALICVCIFIQELFDSSITAFVISALILALFNSSHLFAVYANLPHFLSDFFKQISFAWHFDAAGKGILDSRDLVFFAVISLFCVFAADFVHSSKKGRAFTKKTLVQILPVLFIAVFSLLNSTRYFFRLDFSQNKVYSISKYSKELLKKVDEPVKITYYRSSSLAKYYPQIRDISDFLNSYAATNKNISFLIKDPDKSEQTSQLLKNYGIASQQLMTAKNNSKEYLTVYSAIVIEYNGNAEIIPFLMSADTLEYDLDGRLKHIVSGINRIVNIFIGNGMSLQNDYSYITPWMNSQGFICNLLADVSELETCNGPLLVIGDSELLLEDAAAIERYVLEEKGGVFFAVSPFSVSLEDWSITRNKNTNIVEILENWGVIFEDKVAADISCSHISMYAEQEDVNPFIQQNPTVEELNYPLWIHLLAQDNVKNGMTLFWPVPLILDANAKAYAVTSPSSWYYEAGRGTDTGIVTNPFILRDNLKENFAAGIEFERGTQIVAARITGALDGLFNAQSCSSSDIIVVSDPLFLNSLMIGYNNSDDYGDYRNFDFLSNVLLRLNGEEELAELQSRIFRDTSLYKISDAEQFAVRKNAVLIILCGVIPLMIFICWIVTFISRRRLYEAE
ncbi:MAG: Gldg family protein [Treponema sp.]|nr:Gldg family protein [Treponema sp.]